MGLDCLAEGCAQCSFAGPVVTIPGVVGCARLVEVMLPCVYCVGLQGARGAGLHKFVEACDSLRSPMSSRMIGFELGFYRAV